MPRNRRAFSDRSRESLGAWVDTRPPHFESLREALPDDHLAFAAWLQNRLEAYWLAQEVGSSQPAVAEELKRCEAFIEAAETIDALLRPTLIGMRVSALVGDQSIRAHADEGSHTDGHSGLLIERVRADLLQLRVWVEVAAKRLPPPRPSRKSPKARDALIADVYERLSSNVSQIRRREILAAFLAHHNIAQLTPDGVRDAIENGRIINVGKSTP